MVLRSSSSYSTVTSSPAWPIMASSQYTSFFSRTPCWPIFRACFLFFSTPSSSALGSSSRARGRLSYSSSGLRPPYPSWGRLQYAGITVSRRNSNNWSIVHSRPCSHARRSWRLKSSGRSSGLSPHQPGASRMYRFSMVPKNRSTGFDQPW